MNSEAMIAFQLLSIGSGLFWTVAYLLIIKRGFQDEVFAMPMAALCANITWEFIYIFIIPHRGPFLLINVIWLVLDFVIMYQVITFGPTESNYPVARWFYSILMGSIGIAFGLNLFVTLEFEDYSGLYTAFGGNLVMSILFIHLLLRRGSITGQSIYIALFKMAGTLCSSLTLVLWPPFLASGLLQFLCAVIFILDVLYIFLIHRRCREEAVNPWMRA